jgi:DNA repair protein RecO (recombination protein O)
MPPIVTPATVLSTLAYGETSRITRLATRDLGVVSAIAKGARLPKSPFGAALQILSEGTATIRLSRHSELHWLGSFDVGRVPVALAADMGKYAIASVLGELMLRFAPHEGRPETYDFFRHSLDVLEPAPALAVEVLGLRTIWGLVKALGFAPTLDHCARDGAPIDRSASGIAFSASQGGVLCQLCARNVEAARLSWRDLEDLRTLISGQDELPALDDRYLAAHRRLLDRYIRYHLADGAELPALGFWGEREWARPPTPTAGSPVAP